MDKSIDRIIRRVLEEARQNGRDHLAQTELAVRAICEAIPQWCSSIFASLTIDSGRVAQGRQLAV
jgi:hypothetical protein